jgi:hypothetical protein
MVALLLLLLLLQQPCLRLAGSSKLPLVHFTPLAAAVHEMQLACGICHNHLPTGVC